MPKGVVVSSTKEIAKVLQEHFPNDQEVTRLYLSLLSIARIHRLGF